MVPSSDEFNQNPRSIIHGIPSFVKKEYIYDEAFETIGLFSLAMKIGWRKALSILPNVYLREYIMNPKRLCFTHFLNMEKGSKILDLGAGWGSISLPLARGFQDATIYSLDKTLESLLFLKAVRDQEGLTNLKILHGDAGEIPFHDGFFDQVVMIGTLEYLGLPYNYENPRDGQLKALREVHRVLKTDGTLLIGIENRIGYHYLLGNADHSGLKYTSLMPRFLANIYCTARIGEPYRMYTYSEYGYRRLLRNAGFKQVKIYAAFRTYRNPVLIADLASVKEMVRLIPPEEKGNSMLVKLAGHLPNTILKLFSPHYFLQAVK